VIAVNMLHFFHIFKISCKGNKKHSNNQIKIERYDAHFNLMFIIIRVMFLTD